MATKRPPANKTRAGHKTKTTWKPGQSGNPKGRPKDGESWATIIKQVSDMYPDDILAIVGKDNDLGKAIALLPKNVQMKFLVTARVFSALMFEPTAQLWNGLMDRAEGKVKEQIQIDGLLDVEGLSTVLRRVYSGKSEDQSG